MRSIPSNCRIAITALSALISLSSLLACHSYHIDATIENRTATPITLLEVDYPSASFGADALAANGVFHYSFQTRGSGQMSVQYTAANGHQVQVKGPMLYEKQQGRLAITLLPDGKIEFHPSLQPQH
ncbi:MAG TPA: hypothetical protein VGI45_30780 [Terracidiphilus sp.]